MNHIYSLKTCFTNLNQPFEDWLSLKLHKISNRISQRIQPISIITNHQLILNREIIAVYYESYTRQTWCVAKRRHSWCYSRCYSHHRALEGYKYILSAPMSAISLFPSIFRPNCANFSFCHECYIFQLSQFHLFHRPSSISWRVQIMGSSEHGFLQLTVNFSALLQIFCSDLCYQLPLFYVLPSPWDSKFRACTQKVRQDLVHSYFINPVQDRDKWQAFVNALMNLRFRIKLGEYLAYLSSCQYSEEGLRSMLAISRLWEASDSHSDIEHYNGPTCWLRPLLPS
jgi:hypothetical protein